ncbi:MAG: DNA mismatch repair protein MutS [Candidatus Sumerlaeota bacterium]|nr:DNA mismatch repair protein MutS [Candidatus Sumerlaeota bacterium]
MSSDLTPMLRQYHRIKAEHPGVIVMFRIGDFYETFFEDAVTASKVLKITLTKRGTYNGQPIPLAGVPWHQLDPYLARFLRAGYKVAIAEQTEDPKKAKGVVKREVLRVATPGTITQSNLLDEKRPNFIVALFRGEQASAARGADARASQKKPVWGVAAADLSTGQFEVTELDPSRCGVDLLSELNRLHPAEILLPEALRDEVRSMIEAPFKAALTTLSDDDFGLELAQRRLTEQLRAHDLSGYGAEGLTLAQRAAGALIGYLRQTQKCALEHINSLRVYSSSDYMILDVTTQRSLELVESMHGGGREGTLLAVLDRTITPMGARMLRAWLLQPLRDRVSIEKRLGAIETLVANSQARETLEAALKEVRDIERIVARIHAGSANARDVLALRVSLEFIPRVREALAPLEAELWRELDGALDPHAELTLELSRAISEQPPLTLREGGLIRDGYDEQVDQHRLLMSDSKNWIAQMRLAEIERTGIEKIKIGYNRIFGYFIEISQAALRGATLPPNYIRKQTVANAERFVTPELKEKEEAILHAEERCQEREYEIFIELTRKVAASTRSLQRLSEAVAVVDALASLASVAAANNYARPQISDDGALEIKDGRHPVIEVLDFDQPFVPNDARLGGDNCQIAIITGPNMAGKSTYIRQAALITLMAHAGSFVPAREARIGLVDRIFTRVGAMDALTKGQSTFLVEMSETANILNNATNRSLVILDEIGRGTSTYDGLAIAWAVVEYLHNKPGCNPKTLFATHYHQLIDLEGTLPRVKNFNVAVDESGDRITFLYKIVPGGTDRSYGIYAAQLAGLPPEALQRAREILFDLEVGNDITVRAGSRREPEPVGGAIQLSFFESLPHPIVEKLRLLDINSLTPVQALTLLADLVKEAQ